MKKLELTDTIFKTRDWDNFCKIRDKINEIVSWVNEQELPKEEPVIDPEKLAEAQRIVESYLESEPKEKSLRDAEIERLEKMKIEMCSYLYVSEKHDIQRFYNLAIKQCIALIEDEIEKLKTL